MSLVYGRTRRSQCRKRSSQLEVLGWTQYVMRGLHGLALLSQNTKTPLHSPSPATDHRYHNAVFLHIHRDDTPVRSRCRIRRFHFFRLTCVCYSRACKKIRTTMNTEKKNRKEQATHHTPCSTHTRHTSSVVVQCSASQSDELKEATFVLKTQANVSSSFKDESARINKNPSGHFL